MSCVFFFCFFCNLMLSLCFFCLPAAQPIELMSETMTPVCCWGFLRESRTRGRQTSSPAGHVTPGSGTAVTSEYNVMSVLLALHHTIKKSLCDLWLFSCIICSHWPTCWHQLESFAWRFHAWIHKQNLDYSALNVKWEVLERHVWIRYGSKTLKYCIIHD